jgi:hypothetical protein
MAKNKRLSHDQKRKAKLAKQARKAAQDVSPLAYEGKKYKRDELVPVFLQTETGIYEAYVMTRRQLTDRQVRSALEKLILQLRQGPLPPLGDTDRGEVVEGQEDDLIIWRIRSNWQTLDFDPGLDNLIGVLRTTLNSIHIWSSPSAASRGYLHYIEGFLRKGGISVQEVSAEGEPVPEPEEPELLRIGRAWCETDDREAADAFRRLALEMIERGEAETVVEVCQRLAGGLQPGRLINEVLAMSLTAQKAMPRG